MIEAIVSVTGATEDAARHVLEACGNDVNAAVDLLFADPSSGSWSAPEAATDASPKVWSITNT